MWKCQFVKRILIEPIVTFCFGIGSGLYPACSLQGLDQLIKSTFRLSPTRYPIRFLMSLFCRSTDFSSWSICSRWISRSLMTLSKSSTFACSFLSFIWISLRTCSRFPEFPVLLQTRSCPDFSEYSPCCSYCFVSSIAPCAP